MSNCIQVENSEHQTVTQIETRTITKCD